MRVLAGKPVLFSYLMPFWTAFERLGSCRRYGPTNIGPIPWDAMDRYCDRYDIEGEEYDEFIDIMERLDQVYLAETSKRTKTNPRGSGGK